MTLGLRPGTVKLLVEPFRWESEFWSAAAPLRLALDTIAVVEHVGSTAVRGLPAKPIVDIAIGVYEAERAWCVFDVLAALGYRYRGFREEAGGHIWDFSSDGRHTRYVHLALLGSDQWNRYIVLRDYLRMSAGARETYKNHKVYLAGMFPNDRRQYTSGKRSVIDHLLLQAVHAQPQDHRLSTRRVRGFIAASRART